MSKKPLVIRIDLQKQDGWHVATSKDLPGFVLAHQDRDKLIEDVPDAVRLLYSKRHNVDCQVVESEYGDPSRARTRPPCLLFPQGFDLSAQAA